MEPRPQPITRQVWDIRVSDQDTFDDFRCTFCSALPVVGSTCSDLSQFPHCSDAPKASYARRAVFTAWNVHSPSYVTSFAARQTNLHDSSGPSSHTHNGTEQQDYNKKFLSREDALVYIESNGGAFTTREVGRIKSGTAYITPNGVYYPRESLKRVRRAFRPRDASEIPSARISAHPVDTPDVSSTSDMTNQPPDASDRISLVQGDLPPSAGTSDRPASGTEKRFLLGVSAVLTHFIKTRLHVVLLGRELHKHSLPR